MIEIAEQCRNRWRSILPMFGIGTEFLTGKHGPCPICEGTDRFRFDDKDGKGTFFCTSCRPGDGIKLVMLKTRTSFAEAAKNIRERLGETAEAAPRRQASPDQTRQAASGIWQQSVPVIGNDAARYLAGRGLHGPYPNSLRFCAAAYVAEVRGRLPAMVALVQDPEGNAVNVHRTFLQNGRKAPLQAPRKMMRGDVPDGAAIRLGKHDGRLGIAEGIETALAVKARFGITCWSALDAEKLAKFIPPEDVTELHIFGDHDHNFAGQCAAYRLAHRVAVRKDGPRVAGVFIPETPGKDWADEPELEHAA